MNTLYTTSMVDDTKLLSRQVALGIVGVCLIVITLITVQLLLGIEAPNYYMYVLWFAYASNLVVTPLLVYVATKRRRFTLPAIIWTNLSFGLMYLFFSQPYSPFSTAWAIVMIVTAAHYSWKGFWLSGAVLAISSIAHIALYPDFLLGGIVNYSFITFLVIALTVFLSYLCVKIMARNDNKSVEIEKTRKAEALQANRLNTLINSISDAVLTLNRYGRITSQNAAAQVFFDTNQSLIGRDLETILDLTDQAGQKTSVHDLISSVTSTTLRDDLSIGEGKNMQHLSIQMSRIRSTFDDSEEYGVVVIIRDITKQKTLEEEKDEFISVTSHELRTPVAIAEGSLSNLMVMYDKNADREILRAATKTSYDQVIYLAKIINDLSTLSRAERGVGDEIEDIDVNALLHNLYNRYQSEAEHKSLRLELDVDSKLPHIETSRLYLEEILQNFITNAIKYTKEGSVTIRAKLLENGRITCSVTDTGIGISKPDLDHIFEKFYRSEDYRTRETSGTGLGLYVVQKLADKLETKIEVESRIDHGSTFRFVLPLKSTKLAVSNAPVTKAFDQAKDTKPSKAGPKHAR